MIRRLLPLLFAALVLAAFAWTLVFLYRKSEAKPVTHRTVVPEWRQIIKKTVAPGAIVPRREVTIKPRVSGVIEKLYVEPGQYIKEKALVAKIQIVPNMVSLNNAEANLRAAQINLDTAQREFERYEKLKGQGLTTETEYVQRELAFRLRQGEREAAENNLQLVRVGASKQSGKVSNLVHATLDGMVLEVPVKEGGSVIEANNFNEGTTIASLADMQDMIFQGRVDESDVGRVQPGMPVTITVGALGEQRFEGNLEYIAPKGLEKEGTIQFEVRAAVRLNPGVFLRANYSANADIILDRKERALAIAEADVSFDAGQAYVEVEDANAHFVRRKVELGLSDGIYTEVKSGLAEGTRIKKRE